MPCPVHSLPLCSWPPPWACFTFLSLPASVPGAGAVVVGSLCALPRHWGPAPRCPFNQRHFLVLLTVCLGLSDFSRKLKGQVSSCFAPHSSSQQPASPSEGGDKVVGSALCCRSPFLPSVPWSSVHCPHPELPEVMPWQWRCPEQETAELLVGGITLALFALPGWNAGSWVPAP